MNTQTRTGVCLAFSGTEAKPGATSGANSKANPAAKPEAKPALSSNEPFPDESRVEGLDFRFQGLPPWNRLEGKSRVNLSQMPPLQGGI